VASYIIFWVEIGIFDDLRLLELNADELKMPKTIKL
jgi:hypothetical protein